MQVGGPENRPSVFASAAHVQSLDLHHTGPRSRSEGGLCLLNKHLSEGDQKCLSGDCVCLVCIDALVCVYGGYNHITPAIADLFSVVDRMMAGAGFSCFL